MWQLQGRLRGAVLSTAGGDSASSNGLRLQRGKSRSAPPARPPACAALSGSAPWRPRGARGAAGPDRELPGAAMSFCAFRGAERYAGLFDPGERRGAAAPGPRCHCTHPAASPVSVLPPSGPCLYPITIPAPTPYLPLPLILPLPHPYPYPNTTPSLTLPLPLPLILPLLLPIPLLHHYPCP